MWAISAECPSTSQISCSAITFYGLPKHTHTHSTKTTKTLPTHHHHKNGHKTRRHQHCDIYFSLRCHIYIKCVHSRPSIVLLVMRSLSYFQYNHHKKKRNGLCYPKDHSRPAVVIGLNHIIFITQNPAHSRLLFDFAAHSDYSKNDLNHKEKKIADIFNGSFMRQWWSVFIMGQHIWYLIVR